MNGKCPDCKKDIQLHVSTDNIIFFTQKCVFCDHEHTVVVRNFKLINGQVTGELIDSSAEHFDIRSKADG